MGHLTEGLLTLHDLVGDAGINDEPKKNKKNNKTNLVPKPNPKNIGCRICEPQANFFLPGIALWSQMLRHLKITHSHCDPSLFIVRC